MQRTERELIEDVINDTSIDERFKKEERKKKEICDECPDKKECWSCGVWKWWEEKK